MEPDDIERRVVAALDAAGLPYELIPCDPDLADTAAFCAHYGYPVERSANTIMVASKKAPKQFAAGVVTGVRRLDVNSTVKKLMGVSRASFAKPDETAALTGMLLGGVTVLALPPEIPIYVDEPIMALDWIILGGGSRSLKVKVTPEIFATMPQASVVAGLGMDPPAARPS